MGQRGRPPKVPTRKDGTHPLSSLSKDPIVRDYLDKYWTKDMQEDNPLLPISRDKTKVEYVDAPPLVNDEEKQEYRMQEVEKLKEYHEDEEKTKLRSEIKELHALKRTHLKEIEKLNLRIDTLNDTIKDLLALLSSRPSIDATSPIYTSTPIDSNETPIRAVYEPKSVALPKPVYNGARAPTNRNNFQRNDAVQVEKRSFYNSIRETMLGGKKQRI